MNHFFITGLPRSRTAWLANFLTYGTSFCWHDALSFARTPFGLWQHFCGKQSQSLDYFGDSDSALTLHTREMQRFFPDAKWVLVERDVGEAFQSYWERFGPRYPGGPSTEEEAVWRFGKLKGWLDLAITILPNVLLVDYDKLSEESVATSIWQHCLPDVPFNHDRWRMLETFQINIMSEKVQFA